MTSVKLFYYRRPEGKINFGDDLSPILLEYVTRKQVIWSPFASCDVVGLGSILDAVCRRKQFVKFNMRKLLQGRKAKTIVWGSGFIKERRVGASSHLDFRLVRGPKTSSLLRTTNMSYGDPVY